MEQELRELLTVATTGVGMIDGLAINHSAFPTPFHITCVYPGFDGVHEDNVTYHYEYVPIRITRSSTSDDLSQKFNVTISDINELIAPYLDLIPINTEETPTVELRTFIYRDDGTISDLQDGPYKLQIQTITFDEKGVGFDAVPPSTNVAGTGTIYSTDLFPSLIAYKK